MRNTILYSLFFLGFPPFVWSQTQGNMHLFEVSYNGAGGSAEIRQKTEYINRIGLGYSYQWNKKSIGIQYHFLFGDYVGADLFAALRTSEGLLIASDGSLTDVSVFLRGNSFYASIGRLLPLQNNNFLGFNFCAGALQNRLIIRSLGSTLPFLSSEMVKGYDQFSLGPSLKQELRLTHLGPKRRINFYVGFFVEEAFLKNLRKYNYFNNTVNDAWHFNFLFGIQAGWIIPLYTTDKKEEEFID